MLTQQLGQLFEPSKARLMSQQQEHEMNMLMAKQSWKMQSDDLDALKLKRKGLLVQLDAKTTAVNELGLRDLVNAGKSDGANVEEASTIYDKLDVKNLSDMQEVAVKYQEMIRSKQATLDDMVTLDVNAKIGEKWSDSLTAKTTEKREDIKGKNYKGLHDADKSGTLSWAEQNNALKDYIRDYYVVPEGQEGMDITIGDETLTATPEAHAFVAGFRHVRGRKGVDAAEAVVQVSKLKTPDQYLNTMYQARKTIQGYEQGGMDVAELKFLQGEVPEGFTSVDVDNFTASHSLYKEAYKAYIKTGKAFPDDLKGIAPVSPDMFYDDPEAHFFNEPKEFTSDGLTPELYKEIQRSDNEVYKKMAFEIVYNWEDIMKTGGDVEKTNMLKSFEILKKAYSF